MRVVSGVPVTFIQVKDRERGLAYYCETLGLQVRSSDDFGDFLVVDGALIRLTAIPDFEPHPHPVFGWNVADIDAAARTLSDRGVTFTIYEGMEQDELGIWTAPDGTSRIAWFIDPDGNVLSLSQA